MNPEVTTQKIAELHALRSRISRWRLGTPIAIIFVVVFFLMTIYNAGNSLAAPGPVRDQFVESVQRGMRDDVEPIVRHVALQTFHSTRNSVQEEFAKLSDRTPEFAEAVYKEVETLIENVPTRTRTQLSDILADSFAKQEDVLKEMFPEVTEDNVSDLLEKLVKIADSQAEHLSTRLFEHHLVSINNIIDDLEVIRKSESIRPSDDLASWDMAGLVFDILRSEFDEIHPAPDGETPTASSAEAATTSEATPVKKDEPAAK
jgi:gas vesicle protein